MVCGVCRGLLAAALVLGLSMGPSLAAGFDEAFVKPADEKTWGELLLDFFGQDRYGKSYALVIGISAFDDFSDLPTGKDPIRVKDFLIEKAGFDYVHLLTEENVTGPRVKELIQRDFFTKVGPNDRFFLYWSGHGVTEVDGTQQNIGLFPTAQTQKNDIFSMIQMRDISSWTGWLKAEQTLFIFDACFSGHGGVTAQSNTRVTLDDFSKESRHILTAGTRDQETFASERLDGGVFTRSEYGGQCHRGKGPGWDYLD